MQEEDLPDFFTCFRCGTQLFTATELEGHSQAAGRFKKKNHGLSTEISCTSWFIAEPLQWMPDMADLSGKFTCQKCKQRVGSWNWSGSQCSCGRWVAPAIQFPKSKVDRKSHFRPFVAPVAGVEEPAATVDRVEGEAAAHEARDSQTSPTEEIN
mmetsp:Transcript_6165/g.13524  ORF Transcript_6165/g.13524 Transcript_6165/m.13524 type:complete len:154 (-) Transcript_6165:16-477(-)